MFFSSIFSLLAKGFVIFVCHTEFREQNRYRDQLGMSYRHVFNMIPNDFIDFVFSNQ